MKDVSLFTLATLAITLLLTSSLLAQGERVNKEKNVTTKIPGLDKEKKTQKSPRNYQEYLEYALKKYSTDSEFKAEVDEDYNHLRQDHIEQVFTINTFSEKYSLPISDREEVKFGDTLYSNPLVQDFVNRVGQSLVPTNSTKRYAFKVIIYPVPDARSLSTGTVYITTGLLSFIDTEAQLAYILGHEIAHIEMEHWNEDVLVIHGMEHYGELQNKRILLLSGVAGGVTGGLASSAIPGQPGKGTVWRSVDYGILAAMGAASIYKLTHKTKYFSWDRGQEDKADQLGLTLMFDRNYDPREIIKLYQRLKQAAAREARTQNGFTAHLKRIFERVGYITPILANLVAKPEMVRGASNLRAKRPSEENDSSRISSLEAGKAFGCGSFRNSPILFAFNDLTAFAGRQNG